MGLTKVKVSTFTVFNAFTNAKMPKQKLRGLSLSRQASLLHLNAEVTSLSVVVRVNDHDRELSMMMRFE